VILIGVGGLLYRHRRAHAADRPPTFAQQATWGALGAEWMTRPIDEPWANVPPPKEKVDWDKIIDAEDDDAGVRENADIERDGADVEPEAEVPPPKTDDDRPG
jgi:hypothetical protein